MRSAPLTELEGDYDVIIVGSGYGGAVCASRLASAGQRVCVLERGRELRPGDFPTTAAGFAAATQIEHPSGRLGDRRSLFRFTVDREYGALVGCGLGGTSLINAGVALRPSAATWAEAMWPAALRADTDGLLANGFALAERMLRPAPYTATSGAAPRLPKLEALERSARAMGKLDRFSRPPVTVAFRATTSAAGVEQPACHLCGDCLTGCNSGAKTTLLETYLADAVARGASLFTEIDVRSVAHAGGTYNVFYDPIALQRGRFTSDHPFVRAPIVVLSAGALGSTEILLRSRARGLTVSRALGRHFSGNSTTLAFAYDGDRTVLGVGAPAGAVVGPAIAGMIDLRDDEAMVLQETSVPRALSQPIGALLAASAIAQAPSWSARLRRVARTAFAHPLRRTQAFAVTARDDGDGQLHLDGDRLRIRWPGAGRRPIVTTIHDRVREASAALGATFVANPAWEALGEKPLMTTHPLGGCAMGEDASSGVVDHRGRVFAGWSGKGTHHGLYVCDAAVLPGALGSNPLLTITALAERCAALLARERGWRVDTAPVPPVAERTPGPVGLRFTERMIGHVRSREDHAWRPIHFVCTLVWDDVEALRADPAVLARSIGTVTVPWLSARPMVVVDGRFRLLVAQPNGSHLMVHRLVVQDENGRRFFLDGHKVIDRIRGRGIWPDTTTLHVTLHEGESAAGEILAVGAMTVRLLDLVRQASTMQADRAASIGHAVVARTRFLGVFLGHVNQTYGGLLRPLFSVGAPTCHAASDGLR